MQNAQNTEIQQRVIDLVELYRTKVGKESGIAQDAKADSEFWEEESIRAMMEDGLPGIGMYGEGLHTEIWTKHLMVNEQLLGLFYKEVAGDKAGLCSRYLNCGLRFIPFLAIQNRLSSTAMISWERMSAMVSIIC